MSNERNAVQNESGNDSIIDQEKPAQPAPLRGVPANADEAVDDAMNAVVEDGHDDSQSGETGGS